MNWLLSVYIVLYTVISAGGVWTDIKSKYAWGIVIVDIVASLFGLAALILYAIGYHTELIDSVFRYAFPGFILSCLYLAVIDVYDELKENPDEKQTTLIASVLGVLFEIPSFIIFYLYAFKT